MENTKIVNLPDHCTIRMDNELHESDDFVAILSKDNGDASIYYNTDALTLGMAVKMTAKAFIECMNECSQEDRDEITAILGEAFVAEKAAADEQD